MPVVPCFYKAKGASKHNGGFFQDVMKTWRKDEMQLLFTILVTVMIFLDFSIFICVVNLKTRYYTQGLLTVRTPIWWLFPLSIGPANYASSGRLLLWCPWHHVWEAASKESRGFGWFWWATPSCRFHHPTHWRQAFSYCQQEIQPRDASTLLLVYDECIQTDHIEEIAEHLLVVLL
jgi:hypothetical protein